MLRIREQIPPPILGRDVADVEALADRFGVQYRLFAAISAEIPCVHLTLETPLPLDTLGELGNSPTIERLSPDRASYLVGAMRDRAHGLTSSWEAKVSDYEPDVVAEFFATRLQRF